MNYQLELKKIEDKYKNLWGGINLKNINAYDFEKVIAFFFSIYFNTSVYTTQKSIDHGIDAYIKQNNQYIMLFQVKKYGLNNKVGEPVVRDLYGVMASYALEQNGKQPQGIIVTTGDFSTSAITWAQGKNIILINGKSLIKLFHQKGFSNFYLDFYETPATIYRKAQVIEEEVRKRNEVKKYTEETMLKKQEEMRQDALKHQRLLQERQRKIREDIERQTKLKIEQQYKKQLEETARKKYEEEKRLEIINKEIAHRETQQQVLKAEKRLEALKKAEERKKQAEALKDKKRLEAEQRRLEKKKIEEQKKIAHQQLLDEKEKQHNNNRVISNQNKEMRKKVQTAKHKQFVEVYGRTYYEIIGLNLLEILMWILLTIIPIGIASSLGGTKANNYNMYVLGIYINIALLIHIIYKYIKFKRGKNIFEDDHAIAILLKFILVFIILIICLVCNWIFGLLFLFLIFINYFVLHQIFKRKSN